MLSKGLSYTNNKRLAKRGLTLHRKWALIAMLTLCIVLASSVGPAYGASVEIVVNNNSVTIDMSLALRENLTALPLVNIHLDLANSTTVTQPIIQIIDGTMQKLEPKAKLSNMEINVKTTNTTGTWLLAENYSLTVSGANTNFGNNISSNLAFIPMNLTQSLQVETIEINGIGKEYLLPALQAKSAAYPNLQYFIDGSQTRNAVIPEQTTLSFWLLDFTWVTPLPTWQEDNNVLEQTTSWTLSPTNPRYNLTLGVPSPEGPLLTTYTAIYHPTLSLTIPANAWVTGNTVHFDTPSPVEVIMPIIILASLIIAIAGILLDRRLSGRVRAKKKR